MPRMITLQQAAAETGLSYDCLRNMCLANKLVHIRVGRKIMLNAEKLAAYLNGESDERQEIVSSI